MKIINKLIPIFMVFFLISCASTNMTSFKDPDYETTNFKRILVIANTNDLDNKFSIESSMVQSFDNIGIYAIESFRLFPPTRELTDSQKVEILLKKHIDAYISISIGESGVDKVYIPPSSSTTITEGVKSKTTYDGGYTLSKPWSEFKTELFDIKNGQKVWIANSFTGGNAFANLQVVINSYCNTTVEKLLEVHLIKEINRDKTSDEYYNRGLAELGGNNYRKAIDEIDNAIILNPLYADAYKIRGLAEIGLKDYKGAINDFNKIIEIDSSYSSAYYNRAIAELNIAKLNDAITDFTKAIELNPKSSESYFGRGNAKRKLADFNGATSDFNTAIEYNPNNSEAYVNLGLSQTGLKDYKGAIYTFDKTINLFPDCALAYFCRGDAKYKLGDKVEACSDWRKAVELGNQEANDFIKHYCK